MNHKPARKKDHENQQGIFHGMPWKQLQASGQKFTVVKNKKGTHNQRADNAGMQQDILVGHVKIGVFKKRI